VTFCRSVKVQPAVIPGNPGSRSFLAARRRASRKESVSCALARARAESMLAAGCSRLCCWYRPFQRRGPLNRNDQAERCPVLFPSSITGDPRADTNRAKIKDANGERRATLDFRARKARVDGALTRGSPRGKGRAQAPGSSFLFLVAARMNLAAHRPSSLIGSDHRGYSDIQRTRRSRPRNGR